MDKNETIFDFKVYNSQKMAFFNSIEKNFSFLLDYKIDSKITFGKDEKKYHISDISSDGKFAAIIPNTYEHKNRILRIINIITQEIIFETSRYFFYEVLFTSVPDFIICRADIKGRTKVFVFNFCKNEIVYIFPKNYPLEYGGVNFENTTFVLPGIKKGQVVLYNFGTLETKFLQLSTANIIQRVKQLDSKNLFAIDSDCVAIKSSAGNIVWKTKLDFDTYYYAPYFFIHENKAIFESPTYINKHRYFFLIDLNNGKLENIQLPLGTKIGTIDKYFGDCAMDKFGTILDLKTKELTKLNIEKYII
jgi:hypothetical protein